MSIEVTVGDIENILLELKQEVNRRFINFKRINFLFSKLLKAILNGNESPLVLAPNVSSKSSFSVNIVSVNIFTISYFTTLM